MNTDRPYRQPNILPKIQYMPNYEVYSKQTTPRKRLKSVEQSDPSQIKKYGSNHSAKLSAVSLKQAEQYKTNIYPTQKLKNITYECQFFQNPLPTKDFKSSHLIMDANQLPTPNQNFPQTKWVIQSHIKKIDKVFSYSALKRIDKQISSQDKLNLQNIEQIDLLKKMNQQNVEKEKIKRYQRYKVATQKLIDQFSKKFDINMLTTLH